MKTDPIPQLNSRQELPQENEAQLDVREISSALEESYGVASSEEIEQKRLEAASRIRERDPLDIDQNAERALAGIEQFYSEKSASGKTGMRKALFQARRLRKLHGKADTFAKAFDEILFSAIQHGAPDLGDEVELKSPAVLAKESGVSTQEAARYSGAFDDAIGNTNYVFANADVLTSVTGRSRNHYTITSGDGYVVPVDITNMHPTRRMNDLGDRGVLQLGMYADNIYSIPGFKKVFALYSAALFDSPEDALGFYQTYKHMMSMGSRWDLDEGENGLYDNRWSTYGPHSQNHHTELGASYADKDSRANDKAHAIALSMRELLEQYDIYPPMEPEFQFRDKVAAKRSA